MNREFCAKRQLTLCVLGVILIGITAFWLAGCNRASRPPRTWHVPGELASLEKALRSARDGDTIEIAPGTYTGNWIITKSLEIRGTGELQTDVVLAGGRRGYPILRVEGKRTIQVSIENLTLTGAVGGPRECARITPKVICPDGLQIRDTAEVVLRHVTITDNGRMGVYVADSGKVSIYDCYISNNGRIGLFARTHAKATVEKTIIAQNNEGVMVAGWATLSMSETKIIDNVSYGLFAGDQSSCTLSHSTFRGNGQNGIVLAAKARVSLIATEVTANKGWGIVKMMVNWPTPFIGTIEIDEESTLDGNEKGEIGST